MIPLSRFFRGSSQTILPPNRNTGRLCRSYENQIKKFEKDAADASSEAQEGRGIKRKKEEALHDLEEKLRSVKVISYICSE